MKSRINLLAISFGSIISGITAKSCQDYRIPVTITTENFIFGLPPFQDDFDVADYIDNLSSRSAPESFFSGSVNETASYTVAARFCTPGRGEQASHKNTVLIATHGLNFDRSYWDPQIQEKTYSFVDYVVSQGYSILYYDRLGVGGSTQVSGYKAQLSQQTAILQEITHLVKAGQYVKNIGIPDKIVLVGHSFGSSISFSALGLEPTLADAVILTGFSLNSTYINPTDFVQAGQPRIAAKQHPGKWRQLDTGYVTPADLYANVNTFFKKPDYDVKVARYADANKQPFAVTEVLSASAFKQIPFAFTGAAMIITGQYDFIFCESDCNGALEVPASGIFSNAKDFKAISYPGAGHGLNFHLNAQGAYKEIVDFLGKNGL